MQTKQSGESGQLGLAPSTMPQTTAGSTTKASPLFSCVQGTHHVNAAVSRTVFKASLSRELRDTDLLEERKEHGAAVTRRPDAVHLYGVDKMSTKEVLQYFDSYGPLRVEWIDDSSCNVVFGDQHSAKRAIVGLGRPLGPGEAPDLQGTLLSCHNPWQRRRRPYIVMLSQCLRALHLVSACTTPNACAWFAGLDAADIANLPFLWHKGVDFCKQSGGTRVPLIYRTATVEDKKGMAPTQGSRFLWLRNGKMQVGASTRPARWCFVSGELEADTGDVMANWLKGCMMYLQKQGGKRARPVFDDDGDVAMADASMAAGSHAKRLKPSRQKRKERRANTQGGGEVDMQDAEVGTHPGSHHAM